MPSALALERSHRIHGTCIFPYIYHKTSTIHVGKYTIFPWILWGWIQQFRPSDRECLNQTLCPLFLLRYWVPVSLETEISGWPMKTFSEFGPLLMIESQRHRLHPWWEAHCWKRSGRKSTYHDQEDDNFKLQTQNKQTNIVRNTWLLNTLN